ncbi:MAG: DMT family transporter [Minwuia sp.]|nr:DMT family transporter [Minwuia sp.]
MRMGAAEWTMMLALSLLWGGTFFFVEIALTELGPLTLVLGRVFFGALTLWGVVLVSGAPLPRSLTDLRDLAVMGLLNNAIPFTLIFWGQVWITGGLASVLNATTPIFGVIVAHLLTRDEKATPARTAGVVLGVAGVAVLVGPDAFGGLDGTLIGQIAILGAAISYAFAGVFGRRLKRFAPTVAGAGMLTMSTLIMLPVALLVEGVPAALPGLGVIVVWLTLGIACTGLAYILYFRILATAGATNLLLVTVMIPPSAMGLGVIFLGEAFTLSMLAGFALIFLGLLCVDGRVLDRFHRT